MEFLGVAFQALALKESLSWNPPPSRVITELILGLDS